MSNAEQFIQNCTRNCSNEIEWNETSFTYHDYVPWLTPDQARKAVEITKEELIDKACEWLKNWAYFSVSDTTGSLDEDGLVRRFREAMKSEDML